MQLIKNIIFDLGGVFLNLNYQLTQDAFTQAGVKNFKELFTQHHSNKLFIDLETGKITEEVFYDRFRKETQTNLSDNTIKTAWNAMLLNFPTERIEWLEQINKKYNVFLFSNTNQIHYDAFMNIIKQTFGSLNFNGLFIKTYYSQQIGLRKPNKEAFEFILNDQNLTITETLFIDDTLENIKTANKIGLQTIHLVAPQTVIDLNL
ncbi:MAG: HAD family phosphatase [Bacteroidetes bacterium]|nr:HAD family phosphatase [Bacteroidota bacterium]MBS1648946.1 HAD family phosphatase [Bacteroidota bacterium]